MRLQNSLSPCATGLLGRPLVLLQRHVCQVLLKLNLLLRRGIRGVGRLDGGVHGVGIRLYLSVHFVDVPDLIIEVRG